MQSELTKIFATDQLGNWQNRENRIWTRAGADYEAIPTLSILSTLWDQPRWLEAYHLYDQQGSQLFEAICDLPEYYLTRTENAILEQQAEPIIAAAPVQCIVELGAGYSKKTVHLLTEQLRQRGPSIFAPIDVSAAGLRASRDAVHRDFPDLEFYGIQALYEEGFNSIEKELPTLFVFLGSTIGNFNHTDFSRFFHALANAMGPNDYLLLGADRVKSIPLLEAAYNDSRGITARFILNVFANINRLLESNFALDKMHYQSGFNSAWQQIEMYAVATEDQIIRFPAAGVSFDWRRDEKILVEISRKFDAQRLQEQLGFFDLQPVKHFTDENNWFSVLLFKKRF